MKKCARIRAAAFGPEGRKYCGEKDANQDIRPRLRPGLFNECYPIIVIFKG